MSSGLVFLSYSRREYYFAESLALYLQKYRVNVWFDVQQLEPGITWKADIQDGLERSTALILCASKSAIESPYVRLEWEHALKANKPVYVVVFEAVDLPPELASAASVIDFRLGFMRGLKILMKSLWYRQPYHEDSLEAVRKPRFTQVIQKINEFLAISTLLWIFYTALIFFLPLTVLIRDVVQQQPIYLSIFLPTIIAGYVISWRYSHIGRLWWLFNHRGNYRYADLRSLLWFRLACIGGGVFFAICYMFAFKSVAVFALLIPILIHWLYMVFNRINYKDLLEHPDLLRWCHLENEISNDWRVELNRYLLPDKSYINYTVEQKRGLRRFLGRKARPVVAMDTQDRSEIRYHLYYAEQDEGTATEIKTILAQLNYQETDDEDVDFHILLISPFTPLNVARLLSTEYPQNLIRIMVNNANMKELPELTAAQLLDYRDHNQATLTNHFQYLRAHSAAQRSAFSQNVLPIQLKRQVLPRELRLIYHGLQWLGAYSFLIGLWNFLNLLAMSGSGHWLLGVLLLCMMIGIGIILYADRVASFRPLPLGGFYLLMLVSAFVLILPLWVPLNPPLPPSATVTYWEAINLIFIAAVSALCLVEVTLHTRAGRLAIDPTNTLGAMPQPYVTPWWQHVKLLVNHAVGWFFLPVFAPLLIVVGFIAGLGGIVYLSYTGRWNTFSGKPLSRRERATASVGELQAQNYLQTSMNPLQLPSIILRSAIHGIRHGSDSVIVIGGETDEHEQLPLYEKYKRRAAFQSNFSGKVMLGITLFAICTISQSPLLQTVLFVGVVAIVLMIVVVRQIRTFFAKGRP